MNSCQFTTLIQSNKGIIYKAINAYCRNHQEHDDLIQEILKEAWIAYPSYRGDAKFSTWLFTIARNVAIKRLRKLSKQIEIAAAHNIFYEIVNTEKGVDENEYADAISILTDNERSIIFLYAEGKSYEEIAKITGYESGVLRVKIHRIKTKLKQRFQNQ